MKTPAITQSRKPPPFHTSASSPPKTLSHEPDLWRDLPGVNFKECQVVPVAMSSAVPEAA